MSGSQNNKTDLIFSIYKDIRTVYKLKDIALFVGEENFGSLNQKLNYYVRTGKLLSPRKGIYTKSGYNKNELACTIYTPSYISLEFVLQKAGVIFQYDSRITAISYLSRNIEIDGQTYLYRKLKNELLINTEGIDRQANQINIATPERAFLDVLYLNKEYYFDNLNPLNKELIFKLLPMYQSKTMNKRISKLFQND
jgi:hypothetical protein